MEAPSGVDSRPFRLMPVPPWTFFSIAMAVHMDSELAPELMRRSREAESASRIGLDRHFSG